MMKNISQDISAYTSENKYDFDNELTMHYYPQRIIEKLDEQGLNKDQTSLLELGIGHGYSTRVFFEHFSNYTVLDGDAKIISMFKTNNPELDINIVETYFEEWETDNRYDVIILGYVLEHVDDPKELISKYIRFLTDDGRMYITVPNATSMHRRLGNIVGDLEDMYLLSKDDELFGHKRFFDMELLKKTIIEAGGKLKSIEGMYLKPFTTNQIQCLDLSREYLNALCRIGIEYPELCNSLLAECVK